MKKHILSATIAFAIALTASAQSVPTAQDYEDFGSTRTLVVLDNNIMSDFNLTIEKVMEEEWKPTKYECIDFKTFEAKRQDPSYSFLLTTTVTYEKDKTKARYTYLSLLMGKDKSKVNTMPDLISIPLAYTSVVDQNYIYKMSAFIRFIQKHVETIKADPSLISKNPLLMYNDKLSLANKTLYLVPEELPKDLRTEAAISKIYPHKFKLVTKKDVKEAIETSAKDVVFLHKVGPESMKYNTRCFKMIIGADDSEVYYFNYHNIDKKNPDYFLASDFKKIAKIK